MERRETDRFLVHSNDGQEVEIVEHRAYRTVGPLGEGAKDYETSDGAPVNELGDGHYEVVITRVIYRRVDALHNASMSRVET